MELLAQLGDPLTLECVQAFLLMTWKEEGCNYSEQTWLHLGTFSFSVGQFLGHAIRVAFHLGPNPLSFRRRFNLPLSCCAHNASFIPHNPSHSTPTIRLTRMHLVE